MDPNENPGDGRQRCPDCKQWKYLITHSCPVALQAGRLKTELVKTWKVQVSAKGVHLTLNGRTYELGDSHAAIVFDLERASAGYTVPER